MQTVAILFIFLIGFQICKAEVQEWCSKEPLKNVFRVCSQKTGVGKAEIYRVIYFHPPQSFNEKCFRACSMIECQYYNVDGTLKHDTAHRVAKVLSAGDLFKYELVKRVVSHCLHTAPLHNNVCDTTEAFIQCFVTLSPVKVSLDRALP
ncbi:uncharacterized protein LOC131802284 [Musca domestica]|uniref:Uncharacterized protein LOC131802284 n=1 Tax=Musca domestica TaxID=7370 RepID=A0ABM3UXI0_MUSDO|nr:uncharacterized protein LOC131802284 [Musca domestica]